MKYTANILKQAKTPMQTTVGSIGGNTEKEMKEAAKALCISKNQRGKMLVCVNEVAWSFWVTC